MDDTLQIRASLEALQRQLADGWRQELGLLRAALDQALDQQLSASNGRLDEPSHARALDALAEDLSRNALEQTERARQAVQNAADAVQAELHSRLESEAASSAMLRDAVEDARRQLDAARSGAATLEAAKTAVEAQHREAVGENQKLSITLAEAQRQAEAAQRDAATTMAALTAARQQIETLTAEQGLLQQQFQDLESARATIEAQHHELVTASQKLTEALAELQRDLEIAKHDRDAHLASLGAAERQVETLCAEATLLREQVREAVARHEQDMIERGALAAATEEARESARQAKAETKAVLKATVDHVKSIAESFAQIRDGLRAFDSAKSPADVWQTLAAQLGQTFARAAVFMVRDTCFERTNAVGIGAKAAAERTEVPLTSDSILTRALREKKLVNLHAGVVGLFGQPAEQGVAMPVVSSGRIVAVVYAEQPRIATSDGARAAALVGESLACHAGTCAAAVAPRQDASRATPPKKAPAVPADAPAASKKPLQFPGPARDAQRVMIQRGTQIALDGIPGELIDLSIGGAQLLLTQSVRPNQLVRLTLPVEGAPIACKGRIVWAVFEQSRTSVAMYRAGVKFSDADSAALEAFMNDFQEKPVMSKQRSTSGAA